MAILMGLTKFWLDNASFAYAHCTLYIWWYWDILSAFLSDINFVFRLPNVYEKLQYFPYIYQSIPSNKLQCVQSINVLIILSPVRKVVFSGVLPVQAAKNLVKICFYLFLFFFLLHWCQKWDGLKSANIDEEQVKQREGFAWALIFLTTFDSEVGCPKKCKHWWRTGKEEGGFAWALTFVTTFVSEVGWPKKCKLSLSRHLHMQLESVCVIHAWPRHSQRRHMQ